MVEQNVDASLEKKKNEILDSNLTLSSLKNKLKLNQIPKRIEIYDNSHLEWY